MANLLDVLSQRVVVGDGAMATYLHAKGVDPSRSFEALNLEQPDLVRQVHAEYLDAGAEIIETNSFAANGWRLRKHGLEKKVNEINWQAARLAAMAAKGRDAWVAGAVGPTGLSAEDAKREGIDLLSLFREQIGALIDGGSDIIIFETFNRVEELEIAIDALRNLDHRPCIAMLSVEASGILPGQITLDQAMKRIRDAGADITGVNCMNGPSASISLLQKIGIDDETWLAVYPNAGRPMFYEGRYFYFDNPDYFADKAVELADAGASIIGGCCGTTPAHIEALAKRLKKRAPVRTPRTIRAEVLAEPAAAPQVKGGETSLLDLVKTQRVAIVELDSPRSLQMEKFIQGAKDLKEAGTTAVTLADNSLAILRVSNVAAAVLLKDEGIMPLIHIACRDKNLIGLQSEAMGLAALGFRHLLAITGDPAKFGDHPGASSVYDVNSLGLIECLAGMNGGLNKAGRALNGRSDFLIGCAFNPNAKNLDMQVRKLESKLAKGAHYVMTQPVFDPALVEETHRRLTPLGIPVFMGVMPLFSSRNAEFLHNEVPGITIPEAVREKFKSLPEDQMAAYGVEMARELTDVVAGLFNGIYLITPMLKTNMTVPLVRHFKAKPALS